MNVITKTLQLADGRTITIETGKVAKQTDGAVMPYSWPLFVPQKMQFPEQISCLCR